MSDFKNIDEFLKEALPEEPKQEEQVQYIITNYNLSEVDLRIYKKYLSMIEQYSTDPERVEDLVKVEYVDPYTWYNTWSKDYYTLRDQSYLEDMQKYSLRQELEKLKETKQSPDQKYKQIIRELKDQWMKRSMK